ncbi:hypothetical protein ACNF2L_16385 [Klebsiella pneumoniae]|uniref:hypothetical protein n=1 Tax=Klebsiella pneumoniae TaxID=573 RepID=UPI002A9F3632|nr:hypothetical protein [Klebsiella pneumoniae]HEL6236787.1 hypothetical protein [Klebsiella pneumoniae]
MSKNSGIVGIEIVGGSGNEFNDGKIKINGEGKAIVLDNTFFNKFKGYDITITSSTFNATNIINEINNIDDDTINDLSGKTFKNDCAETVKSLNEKDGMTFEAKLKRASMLLKIWGEARKEIGPTLAHIWELIKHSAEMLLPANN